MVHVPCLDGEVLFHSQTLWLFFSSKMVTSSMLMSWLHTSCSKHHQFQTNTPYSTPTIEWQTEQFHIWKLRVTISIYTILPKFHGLSGLSLSVTPKNPPSHGYFSKWASHGVTMDFNSKMVIHDLNDLGTPWVPLLPGRATATKHTLGPGSTMVQWSFKSKGQTMCTCV